MRRGQDAGAQKGSLHQRSDGRWMEAATDTARGGLRAHLHGRILQCVNIQSVCNSYAKATASPTAEEAKNGYGYQHSPGNGISCD